jgi:type II secretory pathway component PulF
VGAWLALAQLILAAVFYLVAVCYIGGPRWRAFLKRNLGPVVDEALLRIPWRRERLLRDFSRMLALLLDAEVPEPRAVQLAARSTANDAFIRRSNAAGQALARGGKLTDVVQQLDPSGRFLWRMRNAVHGNMGFTASLAAWFESLDAKAFQKEQAAAHLITTSLVLLNGVMVGLIATTVFGLLNAIVNEGVLW